MQHPTHRDNPVAVVDRIAAIVNCVAEHPEPVSISEVARETGLPKSTVFRIVKSVVPHGLLEFQDERLVLGLRFFELGELASRPRTLRRLTFAHMENLRRITGHTVHLAVLDGPHVVYIEILRSRSTPPLPSRVGGRVPAHATAVGKALLAFSPPEVTEAIIERGLLRVTPDTITDPDALRAALWRIRAAGVAVEREESSPGSTCVGAPVLVGDGDQPIAGISISGTVESLDVASSSRALLDAVVKLKRQAVLLPRHGRTM